MPETFKPDRQLCHKPDLLCDQKVLSIISNVVLYFEQYLGLNIRGHSSITHTKYFWHTITHEQLAKGSFLHARTKMEVSQSSDVRFGRKPLTACWIAWGRIREIDQECGYEEKRDMIKNRISVKMETWNSESSDGRFRSKFRRAFREHRRRTWRLLWERVAHERRDFVRSSNTQNRKTEISQSSDVRFGQKSLRTYGRGCVRWWKANEECG